MYSCKFETHNKSEYLRMLKYIDKNNWKRKAIGDEWNCIFIIEFNMY